MPENSYNNNLFDHIDGFELFLIFWVQISSYLPLLQEGTTAEFPALGSSHNRPWIAIEVLHTTSIYINIIGITKHNVKLCTETASAWK